MLTDADRNFFDQNGYLVVRQLVSARAGPGGR